MAFITMDDVFPYLSEDSTSLVLTDDDNTLYGKLIDSVCSFIRNYVQRPIEVETITEFTSGNGTPYIIPLYTPLVSVDEIRVDITRVFDDNTIYNLNDFLIDYRRHLIMYKNGVLPDEPYSVRIIYKAGYEVVPPDLKDVACQMVAMIFDKIRKGELDVQNIAAKEGITFVKNQSLLPEHKAVLDNYVNYRM